MNNQEFKDLYAVLELTRDAEPEVIKAAVRALAKKYHPDMTHNTDDTLFKEIQEAYEILGNPAKKAEYDEIYDSIMYSEESSTIETAKRQFREIIDEEESSHKRTFKQRGKDSIRQVNRDLAKQYGYGNDIKSFKEDYKTEFTKPERFAFGLQKGIFITKEELAFILYNLSKFTKEPASKFAIRNRRLAYSAALTAVLIVGAKIGVNMLTPNTNDTSTLAVQTITEQVEEETTTEPEYEYVSDYVKLYRYHALSFTDTISQLASDAGCSTSDITYKDGTRIDNPSQVQQGLIVKIPYTVYNDDLKYYEHAELFDQTMSLEEFAEKYGTDAESIYNLNKEAIEYKNGIYMVLSDTLNVPDFISLSDLKDKQAEKSYN